MLSSKSELQAQVCFMKRSSWVTSLLQTTLIAFTFNYEPVTSVDKLACKFMMSQHDADLPVLPCVEMALSVGILSVL